MAIASIGHEHVINSTGVSSVTVNKPAGTVDGHRLYALVSWLANTTTISGVPSGWTLVDTANNGQLMTSLYTKVASSEPASWTWTLSVAGRCWGWVGAYSGVHATAPHSYATNITGSGTSVAGPSVTVQSGGWLATLAAGRWLTTASPVATTWTDADGADAERKDISTAVASVQNPTGAVYDSNRALLPGAASRTLTASQSLGQSVAWSLALNPTAPTPTGRIYQAYAVVQPPPAPLHARIYQAYAATAAAGGGKSGRIYQAYATTTVPAGFTPSGIQIMRGGGRAPMSIRIFRNGEI